jgi:hypothetical protein
MPALSEIRGEVRDARPAIGADKAEIYQGLPGMSNAEPALSQEKGII